MLRHKYKYCKNHGLLPSMPLAPYHSPVTSLAILGSNSERQYNLGLNPDNDKLFMLYNDRQYLHRECSLVLEEDTSKKMEKMISISPLEKKSLTVYVTNEYKQCERNVLGRRIQEKGLLQLIYQDLQKKKREDSQIIINVLGIQGENDLTDLLIIDRPTDDNEYLPDHLREEESFLKRRIKVSKHPKTLKSIPENAHTERLESEEDLFKIIDRYLAVKGQMQAMKFVNAHWDWLQGQLFILSEVRYDEEKQTAIHLRSHYILRVNQYLKTSSKLMMKLGMNVRRMQQRYSHLVCDNNESKLFRLIGECFQKKASIDKYRINLVLQVGHYNSLKDQYQCLVPTSELASAKLDPKVESSSFLYIKHYHDHPNLVNLLSKTTKEKKQSKSIEEYLDECNNKGPKKYIPTKNHLKSYVCDTFSSLEKKIVKYPCLSEQNSVQGQGQSAADIEGYIKNVAKLYREEEPSPKNRAESLAGHNRSTFKKSSNAVNHRMSLLEWSTKSAANKRVKVYKSRKQTGRLSQQNRKSAIYSRHSDLEADKGRHSKRSKEVDLPSKHQSENTTKLLLNKHEKNTKQVVEEIVQKEILELGRDNELYREDELI